MTGITEGTIEANGLTFAYLAAGDEGSPLALCLHGFPDTARTWRHLLPLLAEQGYRAVAPWLRGYAPTTVPSDGHYQPAVIGLDAVALQAAFTGAGPSGSSSGSTPAPGVLIGHDWGALAAYAAVHHPSAPAAWRRLVTMAVPPSGAVAQAFLSSYDQLQRSWYMFFFQHPLADIAVPMNDLAFVDRLWADWSPGYDATEDLAYVKSALRDPANLAAALGYYRATLGGVGLSDDPEVVALQSAADGQTPPLPTLYLHGRTDGCMGPELAESAAAFLPFEGSRHEIVDGGGHFLHLERPGEVNRLVLDFVGPAA